MIKDHSITGVGFGGYWIAVSKYQEASGEIVPQQAHNDYLEMIASGGIVGAMLVAWALVEFGLIVRRRLKSKDNFTRALTLAALAGIVTVAIHSIVDFGLHVTINAVLFTSLLSIAVINVRPEEKQSNAE
jgi:O-antigen ligase